MAHTTIDELHGRPEKVRYRFNSIDLLRGLVMVVMALDHTRDFFSASGQNPRDITVPALFLTRWITDYCAPTFILLAGVSAYLYGTRGRTRGEVSWFLLTRGLWLILIEFTVVSFGWNLNFTGDLFIAQVIWAIGASMIVLAGLVFLPLWAIAAIGFLMIAGHNLLDGVRAEALGSFSWIWILLHQPALLEISSHYKLYVLYPLLPWPGVMAAGYVLGPLFKSTREFRRRFLLWAGWLLIIGFVLLRTTNSYGDPVGWKTEHTWLGTLLSFINCEKYPPSLLFLMMTLGPAIVLLALFDGVDGVLVRRITTYGRVPFLFYVVHIPLLHASAMALAWFTLGYTNWTFLIPFSGLTKPAAYGLSLWGVYAVWLAVVVALYPLCRWFAALKEHRHDWWLSYL